MTPKLPEAPDPAVEYWQNLSEGRLTFGRCRQCDHAWLPVSRECPSCLAADWRFEASTGDAVALSWVVYNHAYNDLWADRLPYVVALIELAEGPRLMSNLVGDFDPTQLRIDHPVRLVIESEGDTAVPRFVPIEQVPEDGDTT
ncbi:Zn-ribbon domain-containing OB-fold protein [Herbiconiux ginsengi]|uniref:DUF35 domain-containing protein n=1 Tax=Herbiconiux ginsengi TaxID=381665 RepID=A0A1H3TEX5_9MICO|nr:OB-fold domain-containing protein [Herbiconiux ginsengi]SDZ48794.1 hypothetical protein SAMN05216554_4160 [Herbiconiux ginsengi]